jgi:TonB family protein
MAVELAGTLLEQTLALSAALLVVLALRGPWRRVFGPAKLMPLWLLPPAALLAVALPARIAVAPAAAELAHPAIAPLPAIAPMLQSQAESALLTLWLVGAMAAMAYFIRAQRSFLRELGELRPLRGRLYLASRAGIGPVALGLLRHSRAERALILGHEYSHLRRGDIPASAAATAVRIVFWFNPLVHYAAQRLRCDQELAADAQVLRTHPNARRRYATALLNVQLAVPGLPVGCLWQSSHPLKERIMSIARPQPALWRQRLGLATSFALVATGGLAAWAAQPARASMPPADQEVAVPEESTIAFPPQYPSSALEQHQGGKLVLRVTVSPEGDPVEVAIHSAEPPGVFDENAIAAVRQWKFEPKIENGHAVKGQVLVPICFSPNETAEACTAW